jgi:membrane-bound inhibitor of C-type lysozyme
MLTNVRIQRVLVSIVAAAVTIGAATAATKAVSYTCSDGTRLLAAFSPSASGPGSVRVVIARPPSDTTLPQALSADGGRYARGDVEFWITGRSATLTRAGRRTTCRTRG